MILRDYFTWFGQKYCSMAKSGLGRAIQSPESSSQDSISYRGLYGSDSKAHTEL